mmetsp:Transcript_31404/g.50391  ORF Transcript_31404/g.50391 Transcript_31404/m.50391 type:complete len:128 (-) Transcript_31404:14-397(-)|eukprot:CAMPEP_0169065280 /NCGR_PEP_ID=MMETSP1015-20121227/2314_1 /TAXON_ID=342587 /ORGANISM="Karlodinium micrum, Strain CCMP2283" /LENGTH=127 /DNA_ID=CAMNT_0009123833 /DNA_START=61 /DNA_END=444 /DNA_ORIENTATION=-
MPTIQVVVKKKTVDVDLPGQATFGDLMKAISTEEGVKVGAQVILYGEKEFRMPAYEDGKLTVFDGEERVVCDDKKLVDYQIDGTAPVVCGELQDEWLEEVNWGAFGYQMFAADYMNHREVIVFNEDK